MKIFLVIIFLAAGNFIFSQSSIIYDASSSVDIQTGADVCADVITIHGTYSGGGTICSGALPVTLSLFYAGTEKNNVTLYWKTEAELNNSGFEVQRRTDSSDWSVTGFVNGNGTVNEPSEYTFVDAKLQPGKYFYRLKQIDYNGNFEYFELSLPVLISKPKSFSIGQNYPNPSNPKCRIDYQLPERVMVNISVYDILGKRVATLVNEEKNAGIYTTEFDGTNIASGTYLYIITAGSFKEIKKLVLVK